MTVEVKDVVELGELTEEDIDKMSPEEAEELQKKLDEALSEDEVAPAEEEKPEDTGKGSESEDGKPEDKPGEEEAPKPSVEEQLAAIQSDNEKLRNELTSTRQQFGKWSNEMGQMRKVNETIRKTEMDDETLRERMSEDPREAIKSVIQNERAQVKAGEIEESQQARANEARVRQMIPEVDEYRDEIAALAKVRYPGLSDEHIAAIQADPFQFSETVELARDVKLSRMEKTLNGLTAENTKLKGSKEDILEKIDAAAKKGSKLTAASGQGSKTSSDPLEGLTEADIDNMSDEKVEELTKGMDFSKLNDG